MNEQAPSAEIKLQGIAHYGLRVCDLARARAFYEHLGFKFLVGPVGPEPVAILHHPSGIELNLILNGVPEESGNVLMDAGRKPPGYTHVALLVDSIENTVARLGELGITITEGPITFPGGARALFVRDPDRNVIELHWRPDDWKLPS